MSINGPSKAIVGNSLVMSLDAGNAKSYIGSGTTWVDITKRGNNGTLTNGPTFSGVNGGGIVFDGVNAYVNISNASSLNPTTAITLCSFFKITGFGNNYAPIIFKQNTRTSAYEQYSLFVNSTTVGIGLSNAAGTQKAATISYTLGTLGYYVGVIDITGGSIKLYVNGLLVATTAIAISFDVSAEPVLIGAATKDYIGYATGTIYNAQIYNRALTAEEVLKNYNTTRRRFGL